VTGEQRNPLVAAVEGKERLSLVDAVGGRRGVLDSGLPAVVFVAVYTATKGNMTAAVWGAIVTGGLTTVLRIARRETLQFAISGFVGVAIAAFIAHRTGRAENFFLPGLFVNLGYAAAYAVSILVRWPLLGVVVGTLTGEGTGWRRDPAKLRAFSLASWIWVGMFLLRIAVQLPLYLAGALVPLGAARLAMGWPLFFLGIWLSWLLLRQLYAEHPVAVPAETPVSTPVTTPVEASPAVSAEVPQDRDAS
jgi:hypothetical protein